MAVVVARRPFIFGDRMQVAGEPVVGADGQVPEGRVFTTLLNSGRIYVAASPSQIAGVSADGRRRRV